ncbi:High mobility group B protein 4 [Hirschfeldia incana]|nr:High mobility group B protein 4 [Hirschfeldia incana]
MSKPIHTGNCEHSREASSRRSLKDSNWSNKQTKKKTQELEMKGGQSKSEATSTDQRLKTRGRKKKTATKDPNKPKRPPSAFFVFLDDFRREFKEANPNNKSVAAVGKAAGEKWKSMSDEDKAPYASKAETRKSEYNKSMQQYNMKLANGTSRGEDDESKSEVDEAGGASEEEEEEDDD